LRRHRTLRSAIPSTHACKPHRSKGAQALCAHIREEAQKARQNASSGRIVRRLLADQRAPDPSWA
jgi:hypothetical protein